ncbi:MAG: transcription antitermination protein NusB, partial [Chlorobi bacterium]|nr:transcription antitermination protein NusB [Chlorobiota bacterium]
KQLLDYYFENDKNQFIITANELFDKNKTLWSKFLQDKIHVEFDKTLFVKVFYQLTIQENKIEHYHKIKNYLTSAEFNKLLNDVNWQKAFVVKILEVEKKYEEIKYLVEQYSDSWELNELIEPILNIYPEFCFNKIKQKAKEELDNGRGRDLYRIIATWLKQALKINGLETQTHELINQLYNHKPNLPALKDEFRMEGLV